MNLKLVNQSSVHHFNSLFFKIGTLFWRENWNVPKINLRLKKIEDMFLMQVLSNRKIYAL